MASSSRGCRFGPESCCACAPRDLVELATTADVAVEPIALPMDHPFHLHGFRFQVLDRDGVLEPYVSWKDTVNVPKHSKVRIAVRFEDYAGRWMFHCHILDHEDMGMTGILQIR